MNYSRIFYGVLNVSEAIPEPVTQYIGNKSAGNAILPEII